MTLNTADRKSVRAAEKASRLSDRADRDVITALCSHAAGREWLWNRLEEAHVFSTVWSPDALQMAFSEGQRNSGLRLLSQITAHCPDQFVTMMKEANDRRTRDTKPGQRAGDAADDDGADGNDDSPGLFDDDRADHAPGRGNWN